MGIVRRETRLVSGREPAHQVGACRVDEVLHGRRGHLRTGELRVRRVQVGADRRAEPIILQELREAQPGVEMLGGRVGRQHRPHVADALGRLLRKAGGDLVEEVVDEPLTLGIGHRHEPAQEVRALRRALLSHERAEDGALRVQIRGPRLDHVEMLGEHIPQRARPGEHAAHLRQTGLEVAQRADELEPGDRVHVVEAMASVGGVGRVDESLVVVVADGADAESGAMRHLADGGESVLGSVHVLTLRPQAA